ncbi:MAG: hypothetical protein FWB83_04790 [Treponema sp.]|nr:hypothetical protein [Treponema sp.]
MSDNADFIAYCLEEYKTVKDITGKEAITLFISVITFKIFNLLILLLMKKTLYY